MQRMLDFEAALARAQAKVGIVPNDAAAAIDGRRATLRISMWPMLSREAEFAGNLAIPLVKQLTAERREAKSRSRKIRPLGRNQPRRHRHGIGAANARWTTRVRRRAAKTIRRISNEN